MVVRTTATGAERHDHHQTRPPRAAVTPNPPAPAPTAANITHHRGRGERRAQGMRTVVAIVLPRATCIDLDTQTPPQHGQYRGENISQGQAEVSRDTAAVTSRGFGSPGRGLLEASKSESDRHQQEDGVPWWQRRPPAPQGVQGEGRTARQLSTRPPAPAPARNARTACQRHGAQKTRQPARLHDVPRGWGWCHSHHRLRTV